MPHHHRTPEEYVRPEVLLQLDSYFLADRETFVAGVSFHQKALTHTNAGQRVQVELVPEPRNRWDRCAVALDLDGRRVGYLQTGTARVWCDVVRAWNQAGFALYLPARINRWGERKESAGLTLAGISWSDLDDLAHAAGLEQDFAALCTRLTPAERQGLIEDRGYTASDESLRALWALREEFPQFTWQHRRDGKGLAERMPFWVGHFVRAEMRRHRTYMGLMARVERMAKKRIKAMERAQREVRRTAYLQHGPRAGKLHRAGMSKRAIATRLGITDHEVRKLLASEQAMDPGASTWHSAAKQERLDAARVALAHQRAGLTRSEICERMGRSVESIKQLLSDAKFYETPAKFPGRYELARQCMELRAKGLAKSEVLDAMSVSTPVRLRAFRDASVLEMLASE